jgi:hypothetical protein
MAMVDNVNTNDEVNPLALASTGSRIPAVETPEPAQDESGLGGIISAILKMLGMGDLAKSLGFDPAPREEVPQSAPPAVEEPPEQPPSMTPLITPRAPSVNPADPNALTMTGPNGKAATTYNPDTKMYTDDLSKSGAYHFNGHTVVVGAAPEEAITAALNMRRSDSADHAFALDAKTNSYSVPTKGTNDAALVDKINAEFGAGSASLGSGKTPSVKLNMNAPVVSNIAGTDTEAKKIIAENMQHALVGHSHGDLNAKKTFTAQERSDNASRKDIASVLGVVPATVKYQSANKDVGQGRGTLTIVAKSPSDAIQVWNEINKNPILKKTINDSDRAFVPTGSTLELRMNANDATKMYELEKVMKKHSDALHKAQAPAAVDPLEKAHAQAKAAEEAAKKAEEVAKKAREDAKKAEEAAKKVAEAKAKEEARKEADLVKARKAANALGAQRFPSGTNVIPQTAMPPKAPAVVQGKH